MVLAISANLAAVLGGRRADPKGLVRAKSIECAEIVPLRPNRMTHRDTPQPSQLIYAVHSGLTPSLENAVLLEMQAFW